jgi:L-ascorbate metabolism protein UlaG (beta-lactamase superfamily)
MHSKVTELTWFGQSAFKIQTPQGKILLIDPWITNPHNPNGQKDLENLNQADFILVTHGHDDHIGNAAEIALQTGANLVASVDLGRAMEQYKDFPKAQIKDELLGNFGGKLTLLDNSLSIHFLPALHSSAITDVSNGKIQYGANPGGFLIDIQDGPTIYHTGDTDWFSDMKLVPLIKEVDLMLVCIGGHYTMDPKKAAQAVKWVEPKMTIPMHYGTFSVLKGTPENFYDELKKIKSTAHMKVLEIGNPAHFTAQQFTQKTVDELPDI